ncbi:MAG TPA: PIN domain-containing protein [Chitinophagales bacterium]|nr:PIN domain-containing protein [Chitinophagales bacterium]
MPDVFLDTDVAFDIISGRQPHHTESVKLLNLAALGKIQLMISESSLATLFYLSFDIYKIEKPIDKLQSFVSATQIIHASKQTVIRALQSDFHDKEDALQYYSALHAGAEYFISRNIKDFRKAEALLPVFLPEDFIRNFNIV